MINITTLYAIALCKDAQLTISTKRHKSRRDREAEAIACNKLNEIQAENPLLKISTNPNRLLENVNTLETIEKYLNILQEAILNNADIVYWSDCEIAIDSILNHEFEQNLEKYREFGSTKKW